MLAVAVFVIIHSHNQSLKEATVRHDADHDEDDEDDEDDDDGGDDDSDDSEHLCVPRRPVSPLSHQVSALICRQNICLIHKYLG